MMKNSRSGCAEMLNCVSDILVEAMGVLTHRTVGPKHRDPGRCIAGEGFWIACLPRVFNEQGRLKAVEVSSMLNPRLTKL